MSNTDRKMGSEMSEIKRQRGVHKTMAEKAQEELDKQERLVSRLEDQLNEAEKKVKELRVEVSNERGMLAYYQAHPALKKEGLKETLETFAPDYADEPLPGIEEDISWLDTVKNSASKAQS
jgi:septal ring factor EnvC (AmiA/AmiB activator)